MATQNSSNSSEASSKEPMSCYNSVDRPDEDKVKKPVSEVAEPQGGEGSEGCHPCADVPDTGGGEVAASSSDMELGSDTSLDGAASKDSESSKQNVELVEFKIIFNKQKYDVSFPLNETISSLKKYTETLIGVPPSMQKVMFKGLCKDEQTLRAIGFTKGVKVMVVGSTLSDIIAVNTPSEEEVKDEETATTQKEPFCRQKLHKKIVDRGVPEDVQPGIKNVKDSLPPYPISGMLNKSGGKVRLTFKLEVDQVWIGTKERTDKIPMNSIKNIVSEPIEGHEEYHIMGIQLGTTEASRYWLYWVPAQYVDAIKDAVLGKWQYF